MRKALIVTGTYLLIQSVGGALIIALLKLLDSGSGTLSEALPLLSSSQMLVTLLLVATLAFFATLLICRKGLVAPFRWRATWNKRFQVAGLSLAAMIPLAFFVNALTEILDLPDLMENSFEQMSYSGWALWVMALAGPVSEEVCFRFGVEGSLLEEKKVSPRVAIIVSALIFGVIHMNPAQMLGAFLLGLYFGWLYYKTGSVWAPVVCHVFNNLIAVVLLRTMSKDFELSQLMPNEVCFYMTVVLSLLIALPLLILIGKAARSSCAKCAE